MKKNSYIYAIIIGLLLVGAAFYGGMQYQKMTSSNQNRAGGNTRFGQGQTPGGANAQGRMGGGFTTGEVVSLDSQSLTVKLANGSTKIVFYSASTPVVKQSDATIADLKAGETVMVTASANPDGSISAREIRVGKITVAAPLRNQAGTTPNANQTNFPAGQGTAAPAGGPDMPPPAL
jgi:hypothetical protein